MLFFFYSESKKSVLTEKGRASGLSWKKKIYIIFFFLLSKFFPTRNLVGAVEHVNVIRSLLLSTWVAFLLLLVGFISSLRNCWWCRRRSNSFLLGRIVRVTTWLWNNKREGGKKRETIGIGRWRANRLTRNLCEAIVGRCESFRHAYRHKGATHLVELSYARQAGRQAAGAELLRDALGPFIPLRVISWAVVSLSLSPAEIHNRPPCDCWLPQRRPTTHCVSVWRDYTAAASLRFPLLSQRKRSETPFVWTRNSLGAVVGLQKKSGKGRTNCRHRFWYTNVYLGSVFR